MHHRHHQILDHPNQILKQRDYTCIRTYFIPISKLSEANKHGRIGDKEEWLFIEKERLFKLYVFFYTSERTCQNQNEFRISET